jgi:hypothetical protein
MMVYYNGRLIVIESNLAWALPYWQGRRAQDKAIRWTIRN